MRACLKRKRASVFCRANEEYASLKRFGCCASRGNGRRFGGTGDSLEKVLSASVPSSSLDAARLICGGPLRSLEMPVTQVTCVSTCFTNVGKERTCRAAGG